MRHRGKPTSNGYPTAAAPDMKVDFVGSIGTRLSWYFFKQSHSKPSLIEPSIFQQLVHARTTNPVTTDEIKVLPTLP